MRKSLMLAAACLTIAAAPPTAKPAPEPPAKPAPPATTINCLIASNAFAQKETDQQRKELAHQTLLFYLGRLDPQISSLQLRSALRQAGGALANVNAGSLMNECVAELRSKAGTWDAARQPQQGK